MKKILFISFLCFVFAMFTNVVNAQESEGKCCFYLEQIDPAQIIGTLEGSQYNLNPIVWDKTDPQYNIGKVEYYYFRFINCGDATTKVSIDWEFLVDGAPFDRPMDATESNKGNFLNVEIEWLFPLVNPAGFQGSGPLLSGRGLQSEIHPPYVTINNVKRAVVTDFPGHIDGTMPQTQWGDLYGYFNPYGVQNRWYNYIYADFLEWACANNLIRLKMTRYTFYDVEANFRIMERVGGIDFQEYYIPTQQNVYMGGHGAYVAGELSTFTFKDNEYTPIDEDITVCSGTEVFDMTFSPVIPDQPVIEQKEHPYYNAFLKETCGIDYIDSIGLQTITWNPRPLAPIKDSVALCGSGMATLTASDPYEDDYDFVFNWYSDEALTTLVHTGKTYSFYCKAPNKHYYVYVTSTVNSCEGDATQFVVFVHHKLKASLQDAERCPSPTPYQYCQTVQITHGGYGNYTYAWTDNVTATGAEGCIQITGACDATQEFGVTITDSYSNCTATAQATITIVEEILTFEDTDRYINSNVASATNKGNCLFNADPEVIGKPTFTLNCQAHISQAELTYADVETRHEECVENLVWTIERTWTLTTFCGATDELTSYIYVYDIDPPHSDATEIRIQAELGVECQVVIPDGTIASLKGLYEFYDNCTALTDIEVRLIYFIEEEMIVLEDGDPILCGDDYTYYVEATDACGNSALFELFFDCPAPFTAEVEAEVAAKCLTTDPAFEVEVTVANGVPTYTYEWCYLGTCATGTNPYQFEPNPTAGDHELIVIVTDGNGCVARDTITLTLWPLPSFTYTTTPEYRCDIVAKGTITLSPNTFNYFIGNLQTPTGSIINNLDAGTYTIIAVNQYGCSTQQTITVDGIFTDFTVTVDDPIICMGGTTIARVNLIEPDPVGDHVITYLWSPGGTTADTAIISVANENTNFQVKVINTLGNFSCELTKTGSVQINPSPSFSVSTVDETCFEYEDGKITIFASGGIPPYTYSFDNGATWIEANFKNVGKGTYRVGVKDDLDCISSWSNITIDGPSAALEASIAIDSAIKCFNGQTTITASATGGTPAYTYLWNTGATTATIMVPAGPYSVTVTDSKNCTATSSETVESPLPFTLNITIEVEDSIRCYGDFAILTFTPVNGTPPYYFLGTEEEGAFTRQYKAGTYEFTITDALDCTATATIHVTQPDTLIANTVILSTDSINCADGTAIVTVLATGGSLPYTYSYIDLDAPTVEIPMTSNKATVPAGNYRFKVTDIYGCNDGSNIDVTEPTPIVPQANIGVNDSIACYKGTGTVTVTATGGTPPYRYFDANEVEFNGTITVLAGTHTFTVKDAKDCEEDVTITVSQPDTLIAATSIVTGIACYGGKATVELRATGGTPPYYYNETALTLYTPTGSDPYGMIQLQLPFGTHTLDIIDSKLCEATVTIANIPQPDSLVASIAIIDTIKCFNDLATITASATGGTTPYTYLWTPGGATTATIQRGAGTYTVVVTDHRGCFDQETIVLTAPEQITIELTGTEMICPNEEGWIKAYVEGGVSPYTYLWSNQATTDSIGGLGAGIYSVVVTDAVECTATSSNFTIGQHVDIDVAITAVKECDSPVITVTVTTSQYAKITIQGYNLYPPEGTDPAISSLYCEATNVNELVCTFDVYSSCHDINYIYFVASVNIEDNPCTYESAQSAVVNNTNMPDFYVYRLPKNNSAHDPDDAVIVTNTNTPITHYFRVSQVLCPAEMEDDLRLSVDYKYFYQDEPIDQITNFLTPPVGGPYMRFTTPQVPCLASGSVVYSHVNAGSYFPNQGANGWYFQANLYSFFRLKYFNEREIMVELPGFDSAGVYTIEYELVTHLHPETCARYGNLIAGNICNPGTGIGAVGGNNFYTVLPGIPNYYKVVLGKRTFTIIVNQGPPPPPLPPPPMTITNPSAVIEIYPNPATEKITLKVENGEGLANVRIANLNGQTVLDKNINITGTTYDLELPNLNPGFYFLYFVSNDAVIARKLIIEPY